MALRKNTPKGDSVSLPMKPLNFSRKLPGNVQIPDPDIVQSVAPNIDLDLREVYFLMLHLLSSGPCQKTYALLRHELLEHELLPRRYHAWYSRSGLPSGDENDDGNSFPLNYTELAKRYSHVKKDHLVELLKQLVFVSNRPNPSRGIGDGNKMIGAGVPTLLGTGSFSLLSSDKEIVGSDLKPPPIGMRWPHMHADQVRGISLREIGGGFARHHRAPSIRAACYVIAKPSSMVQKMQNIKRLRGHRNAVYCAILDRSGRYVITGSDDRLVKVWSMDTAYCLASCRGHEGDITDLAVSSNNIFIASASNDCVIRVWRLPDGLPVSVLRGHTGAVTAIAFSPRPGSPYQLLSSSDDGTCRIWDARGAQFAPRIYVPRPPSPDGKNSGPSSSNAQQSHQIFCCAFNASGSVFVTGSSDTLARVYSVWSANKTNTDDPEQPNHEMDVLAGHENDVNYVQFSGCAAGSKFSVTDYSKDENVPKFKNSWFCHDNIVTCSRDGSAIIWIPRLRRSHGKSCRWTRAYHLKVPPPPMPPQPPRGGPRQRILPTPRGVNMIAWSLDNRFVLAAIMDCRICVWNASDGSLVHSLTGHTASTYVMDVHPFNPRIAMSAGYDGKTIVWDIWEGIPIQIYDISHYKLVDGKFSPDGTSIILSDDVGQLYILSTGQGDSQKDAKYDQFFLGDYRPLIQDTYGNVLDQESQLQPYRRNMEDPLCDSGMIPYEEPYQTTFQKRRLGALGKEWRPSSLKLAVGPDITLDRDYQMPPLADLDLAEPLPEFIDVMEWEPEVDILSDENDSEYNVPEEYSSGKEQECLNSSTSGESGSSSGESYEDDDHQNSLRRSKRKKHKKEAGIMTSSGRRVKKRNFDELEGAPSNKKRTRKSRSGRKESKRKSSKSKSSRPRRAAARNALSWFSKITGTSKDAEEEEVSELSDSSESESTTQDSGTGDSELEVALLNGHGKQSKGKTILVCDSDDGAQQCDIRETHTAERRRLVLRFPVRNSDKLTLLENLPGSSCDVPSPTLGNGCTEDSRIPGNQFEGLDVSKVKWGMVKARTTKRIRGEAISSHELMGSDPEGKENNVKEDSNHRGNGVTAPSCLELKTDIDDMAVDTDTVISNGLPNGGKRYPELDGSPSRVADDKASNSSQNVTHRHDLIDSLPPISTTLKIRSKRVSRAPDTSLRQEGKSLSIDQETGGSDALNDGFEDAKCDLTLDCQKDGVVGTEISLRNDCVLELNPQICDALSIANDVPVSHSHPKRMFDFVYRRKSRKHKNNLDRDAALTKEVSPGSCSQDHGSGSKSHEGASNGFHGTELNGLEKSEGSLTHIQDKISDSRGNQNSQEELRSASGATLRLRSTRNRKSTYPFSETKPIETKKPQQLIENVSWLTLSIHEEGSRYIPQMGDEVAYLRQGHQEYLNFSSLLQNQTFQSFFQNNTEKMAATAATTTSSHLLLSSSRHVASSSQPSILSPRSLFSNNGKRAPTGVRNHQYASGVRCMAVAADAAETKTAARKKSGYELQTLTGWLLRQEMKGEIDAELTIVMSSISLACKQIASLVQRAGISNLTGVQGAVNIQGEDQKKLDVISNEVFSNCLRSSGRTGIIASEEEDVPVAVEESYSGNYVVVFDPLDGSSNIDAAVSTGSIFGIYSPNDECIVDDSDDISALGSEEQRCIVNVCQPGNNLLAAGYCMYSSSVIFVLTLGKGVFSFTLDPMYGEFVLTQENIEIPKAGRIYSFNEGNYQMWDDKLKKYIDDLKDPGPTGKPYSARYIGSLVGDFHRTLLYGGIYGYPRDAKSKNGKLRLLYECAPMSFIVEQAGGKGSDGHSRVLDIQPTEIHQRVPLYIGSTEEVEKLEKYLA